MSTKSLRVWYWITTGLFAAFSLMTAIAGINGSVAGDAVLVALGYPLYLNLILGVAKISGSVALIQTKFVTIKEWAYAGFTFDMLGAIFSFLLAGMGFGATIFAWVTLILMFISYALWKKTA